MAGVLGSDEVRAIASFKLHELKDWLTPAASGRPAGLDQASVFFAYTRIEQFEKDPKRIDLTPPVEPPDGPPIGSLGALDCEWPN